MHGTVMLTCMVYSRGSCDMNVKIHVPYYHIVKIFGSKKFWRLMINSIKFYPPTFLFYFDSLLCKHPSFLYQNYFEYQSAKVVITGCKQ